MFKPVKKLSDVKNDNVMFDKTTTLDKWGDFVLLMMFFVTAYIMDMLIEAI